MSLEECYKILELPAGANAQEVKRAYRKKAKLFHPDVNNSIDAQKQFILINEAYETLLYGSVRSPREIYRSPYHDYYRPETRQEKAARYARIRYEEFKRNNEAFKNSLLYVPIKLFTYSVWLMGAFVAITFLLMPLLVMFVDKRTGISMLPISFVGMGVMSGVFKLKREIKQYF